MKQINVIVKIILITSFSLLAVFYNQLLPLFILLFSTILIVLLLQVPMVPLLKKIKHIIKLVVILTIIQSILIPSNSYLLSLFTIPILTIDGIYYGITLLTKLLIILLSASILLTSASHEIIAGLIKLKLPYEVAFMAIIGAKFIPYLKQGFDDALNCIQMRGIDIKKQPIKKKVKLITSIIFPIIARSIMLSKNVAIAMQMRGFRSTRPSLYYAKKLTKHDYIGLTITFIYTMTFISIFTFMIT